MDPNRIPRRLLGPTTPPQPPTLPAAPAASALGLVRDHARQSLFPRGPELAQWQQALYQWAYDQAQELLKPSLFERDWLGVWN